MRTLRLLALIGLVVSCHLDKLLNGGGRGPTAVSNGTPAGLTFSALPAGARAGSPIRIQVNVVDSTGVPVLGADSTTVTLSLGSNPGGAPLRGTTTAHPSRGVATFSDLSIDRATSGYSFKATDSSLTVTSDTFTVIPGPATQLTFTAPPHDVTQGGVVTPPVVVTAFDALDNKATDFTGAVTLQLLQNDNIVPGVLSGATVNAAAGAATFDSLRVGNAGAGSYTLAAAFGGRAPVAKSSPFNVKPPGPPPPQPGELAITTVTTGINLPSTYTVTLDGNAAGTVGANGTITVPGVTAGDHSVGLSDIPTTCNVTGANPVTVNVPAGGTGHGDFALTCGAPPPPPPPSTGPYLQFTDEPFITQAGHAIPAVRVTVYDASGNQNRTYTGDVTISIGFNPSGGTLSGGGTITMDLGLGGVVEWDNLIIDKPGYGYTFHATSPGLRDAFSDPVDITADPPPPPNGATGLGYFQAPTTTQAGAIITPAVRVGAINGNTGTVATGYNGPIWISLGANPGGATLSGTRRVVAVNGYASFPDLRIDKPGQGYTLRATAWPLNYKGSVPFDVTAASPVPPAQQKRSP